MSGPEENFTLVEQRKGALTQLQVVHPTEQQRFHLHGGRSSWPSWPALTIIKTLLELISSEQPGTGNGKPFTADSVGGV
jgi:hypothetical protein